MASWLRQASLPSKVVRFQNGYREVREISNSTSITSKQKEQVNAIGGQGRRRTKKGEGGVCVAEGCDRVKEHVVEGWTLEEGSALEIGETLGDALEFGDEPTDAAWSLDRRCGA